MTRSSSSAATTEPGWYTCTSRGSVIKSRKQNRANKDHRMKIFKGRTAVITGAASGFGLEVSRIAATKGMAIVMADVEKNALDQAADEITGLGVQVLPCQVDV